MTILRLAAILIDYLCKINERLDAKFYQKILDKDFIETLDYYELDAKNIIFIQNNDFKYTAIFKVACLNLSKIL
ncbi:hypothetical protein GLOIN_2v1466586 [Rhizophagus irregularis DAOM 181602=DAOM 197198]|nr:hypothetical protein GLOIN_2v1466586 [Rhizophagus irregularis DAOM 181602=DAOM 197198]